MLKQLLRRGQLTIPRDLLRRYALKEQDYVEVSQTAEGILIRPVSITDYSLAELETLRAKLNALPRGKKHLFRSFEESKRRLDALKRK